MGWRKDTRAVIREYPQLKRRERQLKDVSLTANYGERAKVDGQLVNVIMPGGGSASRTTEDVALRQLSPEDQRNLDAVERSIHITRLRYPDADRHLDLVRLVYWTPGHNLVSAAEKLFISYSTASAWNRAFVELVNAFFYSS